MCQRMRNGAFPMSDEQTRGERLQIMLSPDELNVLDDFRFKERMPSRAAAVRELLKRGLAAEGYAIAAYGSKVDRLRRDRQGDGATKSNASRTTTGK